MKRCDNWYVVNLFVNFTENIEDGETCNQDDGIEEPDEDKGDDVTKEKEAKPADHEEALGKMCQIMTQEDPPQPDPKLPEMANLFEFLPKPSSVPGGGYPGARRPSNAAPLPTDNQMTTHVWTQTQLFPVYNAVFLRFLAVAEKRQTKLVSC